MRSLFVFLPYTLKMCFIHTKKSLSFKTRYSNYMANIFKLINPSVLILETTFSGSLNNGTRQCSAIDMNGVGSHTFNVQATSREVSKR